MFKNLGNLASMMRQAQQIGGKMQDINKQLKSKRATGKAGGGLVEVEVNGLGEMLKLTIDPSLIEKGEREMIEDLVPAAVNQAQAKAKELAAELQGEAMRSVTEGLNLPGLDEALAQFTPGADDEA